MTIAPATRHALRRLTAKDGNRTDQITGKFWCSDSDSDLECDDPRIVESCVLRTARPTSTPSSISVASVSPRRILQPPPSPSPTPRRIRLPVNAWKGPLSPPRNTPAATFGDYIRAPLQRVVRRRNDGDPHVRRLRNLNSISEAVHIDRPHRSEHLDRLARSTRFAEAAQPTTPGSNPTPTPPSQDIRRPKRRLINPSLFDTAAATKPTYRDVLMAGGGMGRRGSRGGPTGRQRGRGRGFEDRVPGDNQGRALEDARGRGRERGGRGARGGTAPAAGREDPPPAGRGEPPVPIPVVVGATLSLRWGRHRSWALERPSGQRLPMVQGLPWTQLLAKVNPKVEKP